ncbi:isoprenylcysteine carboxyl methyltransferase family protein [Phenylobacterium sp.]|uniref:isoprenylcysteine carboxyl methyltransferase family protein n=1 Tax=Phenylobacterium sp. TaxID=1871053 RepID=UPI002DE3DA2E|nr:isoprenylcysteine carboxylmethyltransferase family protein [Phenylobacterium sp.]
MTLATLVLGLVTLQRLAELVYADRNTRRLIARGAVESGAEHYPIIVGLHAAWLAGLWWWGWNRPTDLGWLGVYVVLQGLRTWTLVSLGERWTTRIIVLPGEPLVRRGPYRFFPHPNYAVVAAEIAVLPLVFHMPAYAALFSALNASILWVRIRAEGRALSEPLEEKPQAGVKPRSQAPGQSQARSKRTSDRP